MAALSSWSKASSFPSTVSASMEFPLIGGRECNFAMAVILFELDLDDFGFRYRYIFQKLRCLDSLMLILKSKCRHLPESVA